MDIDKVITLFLQGNQLKQTPRTGWLQRGVVNPENVAGHTFGVAYIALVLSQLWPEPLDVGKLLTLALLHDLPEALTSDIPTPAWRFLPAGIKTDVERAAMGQILAGLPLSPALMAFWEELHADQTAEARLVHDADKLELYLQAWIYEQQSGNQRLQQFWDNPTSFRYPLCEQIFNALQTRRVK